MGKKMRSYSIFILFLVMSMSVFADIKIKSIDYSGFPTIVLSINGNKKKATIKKFKEEQVESFLKYDSYGDQEITESSNEWVITYVSLLKDEAGEYLYGEDVEVSFTATTGKKTYEVSNTYKVPEKPEDLEIKTYEEYKNDGVIEPLNGYKFTKGGAGSYVTNSAIYVTVPASDSDEEKIEKLYFEKLDESGNVIARKTLVLSGETGDIEISYKFFGDEHKFTEGAHTVQVTPINEDEAEGDSKELKFVVDTRVNDTYLEGGIIGELDSDGKIKINLSEIKELSGIKGYSYTLKVGNKTETGEKVSISGKSYLEPSKDSELGIVEIATSGLIDGSKGTLLFTVYDKLGHERTFEKTYFIPTKPTGIISKIEGEAKQRNSRIKIVTEGNKDKFGISNSSDGSSE